MQTLLNHSAQVTNDVHNKRVHQSDVLEMLAKGKELLMKIPAQL